MNNSEAAAASGAAGDFKAKLASYRDLVLPTLLAVLPQREPRRQLYDLIAAHMSRAGKGLRPALCIATCRAFGGGGRRRRFSPTCTTMKAASRRPC